MTYHAKPISRGVIVLARFFEFGLVAVALALAGCAPDYSPNTYAADAVQQANKVETGFVVGYREVKITAAGTVGIVTGGAAGGILGAQADPSGIARALGAVGGTLVGGVVGTAIEHASDDTTGWEYIVRTTNGDMLSVTQRQPTPIPIGQKVLVITGKQARVIPDYAVSLDPGKLDGTKENKDKKDATTKPTNTAASTAAPTSAPAASAANPAAPAPVQPTAAAPATTAAPATAAASASAAPPQEAAPASGASAESAAQPQAASAPTPLVPAKASAPPAAPAPAATQDPPPPAGGTPAPAAASAGTTSKPTSP